MILLKEPSREKALLTLNVMTEMHFLTSENPKKYHAWTCQNVCDALTFLLDNIFIRFGTKLYRQVVGILMGTNCAPLVADLFLFCYERDFMMSLSDDKQAHDIDVFNTTSRYLDDILNINNVYFDNMVSQIYPSELQLNKANTSDTEAAFLDLHLSISNDIVSTKIYDKRDDFDFEIVNFPFIDGDVPHSTRGGSICNENPFITSSTNALGFYAICQIKDQSIAFIMVQETLFYISKFNKLQTF